MTKEANRTADLWWRSLLFVPGDNAMLLAKAQGYGADGLILDLEDAIAPSNKHAAREMVRDQGGRLFAAGRDVLVRLNADENVCQDVLSLPRGVRAVLLPKVETGRNIAKVDTLLGAHERDQGLRANSIKVVALIETPSALFHLPEIAQGPRVIGIALGTEDFSAALGVEPTALALRLPAQQICLAASAAGIMALAIPRSIADFTNVDAWNRSAKTARAFGATGGLCIHPAQIDGLNAAFSPTGSEVAWAEQVIAVWGEAKGRGVAVLRGKMIDRPVVERAKLIMHLHDKHSPTAS